MRVTISGGGTGGHVSPAVAIVEELRRRDPQLLLQWIGRTGGMEERAARQAGVPFRGVPVAGWPRKRSLRMLGAGARLVYSTLRAGVFLKSFKPQVVIGVGGYVCLPALLAAQRLGIPTILHEQNKRLGMANRLAAPQAARVLLSYPDTLGEYPRDRALLVGNPVRTAFLRPPAREEACERLGLQPDRPVLLAVGGSQGARSINDAVAGVIHELGQDEAQVIWMTGNAGLKAARAAAANAQTPVHVFPFIEDMPAACAAADLIISRAGASSTAEIAAMGKASILVPYPHATDNHQELNARAFESAGAARLLLDDACTPENLLALLRELLAAPATREQMGAAARALAHPLAGETIAEEVIEVVFGNAQ